MENNSYVYQHVCLENDEIFYIGIGTYVRNSKYLRAHSLNNRNKVWHAYVKKHGEYKVEILYDEITRAAACEIETGLIKSMGRIVDGSGRLANISFGGERTFYGMIRTAEHNKKIAAANKGKKISDETRRKQSERMKGCVSPMKGRKLTMEQVEKIKLINIGNKYNLGKKHSPIAKEKMRAAKLGKPSNRVNWKMSESHKKSFSRLGSELSDEHKEKIRARMIGNKSRTGEKFSDETKLKMKIAQQKRRLKEKTT